MLIPALLAAALVVLGGMLTAFASALVSVDPALVRERAAAGDRRFVAVERSLERPGLEVSEAHLGVLLCAIGVGALVEPFVAGLLGPSGMVASTRPWSVAASLALAAAVQVIVGEMVARSVGAQRPVGTLAALARPLRVVTRSLQPISVAGDAATRRLLAVFGVDRSELVTHLRSREELRRLVQLSERSGAISSSDAELFDRTLRFGDKTAADAFTPRVEVRSLPHDARVGDLIDLSAETGYSRFPVHGEDLDDIVGIVHVKDVLGVPSKHRREQPVRDLMRPVLAVPETKDLESLMLELRVADGQFALVVDEYGGTAGIVTLEDLIEEIVGDISDEHDPVGGAPVVRRWGGAHLLSGSLHPDEVFDACGLELPDGDYETIAGFVMTELGTVPEEGERFEYDGWDISVVEMEGNRIRTIKVVAPSPGAVEVIPPMGNGLP